MEQHKQEREIEEKDTRTFFCGTPRDVPWMLEVSSFDAWSHSVVVPIFRGPANCVDKRDVKKT